jgi:hypothetical protein
MKRPMLLAVLAVAAIALIARATPGAAAEAVPFLAAMEWTRTSEPGPDITAVGTGNATHLGDCTGVTEVTRWYDEESGVFRAHADTTLAGPQGDQIFLEVDQVWNAEKDRWEGTYVITDGTGKFEGASGYGENKGKITSTPGVTVAEFEGVIIY